MIGKANTIRHKASRIAACERHVTNMLSSIIMTKRRVLTLSGLLIGLLMGGCVAPALLPTAAFTYSSMSGESPLIVTFDASGSQAPDGAIVEYVWDYGDGTTGGGMIVAHSYQTDVERAFTVTLQIIDHLGQQSVASTDISVSPPTDEGEQASVEFVWPFHFDASGDDAANLNDEYFTLQNKGDEIIDLSGWTVGNERGVVTLIPNGVRLAPNAVITVHSGNGSNTTGILYWNASEPVWNDTSDLAVLRDAEGAIVDFYAYSSC